MKRALLLLSLTFILFGIICCSSTVKNTETQNASKLIVGKWRAVYWEKFDEKREADDLGYILEFSKDYSFKSYTKAKKVLEGRWILNGSLLSIESKGNELEKAELLKLDQDRLILFKASQNAKFIFERK